MKILVTGATGKLGAAVIEQLLQKTDARQIAALVRDENKAADLKAKGVDIRLGSYDDVPSLDRACRASTRCCSLPAPTSRSACNSTRT